MRRGFLALIIPKKATNTKVPDDRIKEYMGKIEELVNSELKIKGEDVKYHLGKAHPSGKSFRELYGNWKAASFCIELSSRNAPNN